MEATTHIEKEIVPVVFAARGEPLTQKGYLFIEGEQDTPDGLRDYSLYSKENPEDMRDGQIFSSKRPFKGSWSIHLSRDTFPSDLASIYIVAYGDLIVKTVRVLDDKDISSTKNYIYWEQIQGPFRNSEGKGYASKRVLRESLPVNNILYTIYYDKSEVSWREGELFVEAMMLFKKPFSGEGYHLAKIATYYDIKEESQRCYGYRKGELEISYGLNYYNWGSWEAPCEKHLEDILGEMLTLWPFRIDPVLTLSRLFSFAETERDVCKMLVPCPLGG